MVLLANFPSLINYTLVSYEYCRTVFEICPGFPNLTLVLHITVDFILCIARRAPEKWTMHF